MEWGVSHSTQCPALTHGRLRPSSFPHWGTHRSLARLSPSSRSSTILFEPATTITRPGPAPGLEERHALGLYLYQYPVDGYRADAAHVNRARRHLLCPALQQLPPVDKRHRVPDGIPAGGEGLQDPEFIEGRGLPVEDGPVAVDPSQDVPVGVGQGGYCDYGEVAVGKGPGAGEYPLPDPCVRVILPQQEFLFIDKLAHGSRPGSLYRLEQSPEDPTSCPLRKLRPFALDLRSSAPR